jgi:hypothetical protein
VRPTVVASPSRKSRSTINQKRPHLLRQCGRLVFTIPIKSGYILTSAAAFCSSTLVLSVWARHRKGLAVVMPELNAVYFSSRIFSRYNPRVGAFRRSRARHASCSVKSLAHGLHARARDRRCVERSRIRTSELRLSVARLVQTPSARQGMGRPLH